jgi:hypothetical protein
MFLMKPGNTVMMVWSPRLVLSFNYPYRVKSFVIQTFYHGLFLYAGPVPALVLVWLVQGCQNVLRSKSHSWENHNKETKYTWVSNRVCSALILGAVCLGRAKVNAGRPLTGQMSSSTSVAMVTRGSWAITINVKSIIYRYSAPST